MTVISFSGYVAIINRNSKDMSLKQQILKAIYPLFKVYNKISGSGTLILTNKSEILPPVSFYDLSAELNNGEILLMKSLKGKKVLLVNTASNCGYTPQYTALQRLHEEYIEHLYVIGFPANNFKEQEKGTDDEIAEFCKKNYGISFPLTKKCSVIKGNEQHEVFDWLTDKTKNGWNSKSPGWNFTKYLVSEKGFLLNYFGPTVSPGSNEVHTAINK